MLELQKFEASYGSTKKLNPLIFELQNIELPNHLNLFFTAKPVEEKQTKTTKNTVYIKLINSTTKKSVKYKFNRPSIICDEEYEEVINVKLIDDYNVSRGDKITVEISSTDYSNILLNKPNVNQDNLLMGRCESIIEYGDFVMGNWNNLCLINEIKFPKINNTNNYLIPTFTSNLPYGFLNINRLNNSWFSSYILRSDEIKNLKGDVRGFFMLESKYEESYTGFTGNYIINYFTDNSLKLTNISDYFNGRKNIAGTFVNSYLKDIKFKPTKMDRMFANVVYPFSYLPEFDLSICESANGFMMNNTKFNLTINDTMFKNTNYIKSIDNMFSGCTDMNIELFPITMNFNGLKSARDLTLNSDINPIFNDLFLMKNLVNNNVGLVDLTNIDLTILGEDNLKEKKKYNLVKYDSYTVQKPSVIKYNRLIESDSFMFDIDPKINRFYFTYPKADGTYTYDDYNLINVKFLTNLPKGEFDIHVWGRISKCYYRNFQLSNKVENVREMKLTDVFKWDGQLNLSGYLNTTKFDLSEMKINKKKLYFNNFFYGNAKMVDVIGLDKHINETVLGLKYMFYGCGNFNKPLNFMTSNVIDMSYMFSNCTTFNQPLNFDTQNVTDFSYMFDNCRMFNQPLKFNTKNAINLTYMLQKCVEFNQPITFDAPKATTLSYMFYECIKLDSSIKITNLTSCISMSFMFSKCSILNKPIELLGTSKVTMMNSMFSECYKFNQLLNLDTQSVTNMSDMFRSCEIYNQPITFDTRNVTNMAYMFSNCYEFNNIEFGTNNTLTPKLTSTNFMFQSAKKFNKSLNGMNTSNVTNMSYMMSGCESFNQPINKWNTSKVTNMKYLFFNCKVFNQSVDNFDTQNVTEMDNMFSGCTVFNQPLTNFNYLKVTSLTSFLSSTENFNQNMVFDIPNCKHISGMFANAIGMKSNIEFKNSNEVINASNLFHGVGAIDFNLTLNLPKCTSMSSSFQKMNGAFSSGKNKIIVNAPLVTDCADLFLDSTNFNSEIVLNTPNSKRYLQAFTNLTVMKQKISIDITSTTSLRATFRECNELTEIEYLGNNNGNKITSVALIYSNCYELKKITNDITDYSNVTDYEYMMFYYKTPRRNSNMPPELYDSILKNIAITNTKIKNVEFRTNYNKYTSVGAEYRQMLIDNMGWKFIDDILIPNPNLLNRGLEVDDVIIDDSNNLIIVDWDAKYATSPFIKYDVKNKYVLSKTPTSGSDFRICAYDENFNLIGNRLYVGSDVYVIPFENESIKYIRVSYQKSSNPKLEIGTIVTPHIEDWIPRQNIISPSRVHVLNTNNTNNYPIIWQPKKYYRIDYATVTPTENSPTKYIDLYSGITANGTASTRLMSTNFKDKHLLFSFDACFNADFDGFIMFNGYTNHNENGIDKTNKSDTIYVKSSKKIGWQRLYVILPKTTFNPQQFVGSLILRYMIYMTEGKNPTPMLKGIKPNIDFLETKNFKVEVVDNETDEPTPYIKSDIIDAPNILNYGNDFITNSMKYEGSTFELINGNTVVEEWGAVDAKTIQFKGGLHSIYSYQQIFNTKKSTPYTYMCWVKNPSNFWISFETSGLMDNPSNQSQNHIIKWLPPNFNGLIIQKGWSRAIYESFQVRHFRVSDKEKGVFILGETLQLIFWREKLYEGHEDSIWTKGTLD